MYSDAVYVMSASFFGCLHDSVSQVMVYQIYMLLGLCVSRPSTSEHKTPHIRYRLIFLYIHIVIPKILGLGFSSIRTLIR
jgi:hypothetical protein